MTLTEDGFRSFVEMLSNGGRKKCKFCGKIFAATTSITRFKWHWSGDERRGVTPCGKVTPVIQDAAFRATHRPQNKRLKSSSDMIGAISTSSSQGQTNQVCNLVQEVQGGKRTSSNAQAAGSHMQNKTGEMSRPMHTSFTANGLMVNAAEPCASADARQGKGLADLVDIESTDWQTLASIAEFLEIDIENEVEGLSTGATFDESSSSRHIYDVYLSFRADTRKNFTDPLYSALVQAGIRTFRDDELSIDEDIETVVLNAIQESKVSMAIFSKGYASSAWCLDELALIMNCKNTIGQIVCPIYIDVDPSEVEKQTGSFSEAFETHEELCEEKQRVSKWRGALEEASKLPPYALKDTENRDELTLIQKIVKEVSSKLKIC